MASKRLLKKYVRNVCGSLAAEMLLSMVFPSINHEVALEVVEDVARLQAKTLRKVSISFAEPIDRHTQTKADIRKARTAYFKKAYAVLLEEFDQNVEAIVKKMNSALPEDVRAAFKELAANA